MRAIDASSMFRSVVSIVFFCMIVLSHAKTSASTQKNVAQMQRSSTVPTSSIIPRHQNAPKAEDYAPGNRKMTAGSQAGAGSTLPDCSHACGACSPCKRVMISFTCSISIDSEACPITYRCMCKGKFFPPP